MNAAFWTEELPAKCQLMTAHPPDFKLSSFPWSLRQELVPQLSVTPIDAFSISYAFTPIKLVDYVISGLSFGFHLGFNLEPASSK